jgi:hypothetical protein
LEGANARAGAGARMKAARVEWPRRPSNSARCALIPRVALSFHAARSHSTRLLEFDVATEFHAAV